MELGLTIRGLDPDADRARAALDRLGIARLSERRPAASSAGERLRVALARAIVAEPALLILDEPTASLDRSAARDVARPLAGFSPAMTVDHGDPRRGAHRGRRGPIGARPGLTTGNRAARRCRIER